MLTARSSSVKSHAHDRLVVTHAASNIGYTDGDFLRSEEQSDLMSHVVLAMLKG